MIAMSSVSFMIETCSVMQRRRYLVFSLGFEDLVVIVDQKCSNSGQAYGR